MKKQAGFCGAAMTLKQKREIVQRFKGGAPLTVLIEQLQKLYPYVYQFAAVEDAIRDFMNGKFTVPRWFQIPKKKALHK